MGYNRQTKIMKLVYKLWLLLPLILLTSCNKKEDVNTPGTPDTPKQTTEEHIKEYISNLQYVDLGLPSGTLWSEDLSSYQLYGIELEYYNANWEYTWGITGCYQSQYYYIWKDLLPSKDQAYELIGNCQWEYVIYMDQGGFEGTGPNGNKIFLGCEDQTTGHVNKNQFYGYYWCAYERNGYPCISLNYLADGPGLTEIYNTEGGYSGRVRLVKKKSN